jgi:hypothetical protein
LNWRSDDATLRRTCEKALRPNGRRAFCPTESGRKDLNLRPSGPKPDALARLRHAPYNVYGISFQALRKRGWSGKWVPASGFSRIDCFFARYGVPGSLLKGRDRCLIITVVCDIWPARSEPSPLFQQPATPPYRARTGSRYSNPRLCLSNWPVSRDRGNRHCSAPSQMTWSFSGPPANALTRRWSSLTITAFLCTASAT